MQNGAYNQRPGPPTIPREARPASPALSSYSLRSEDSRGGASNVGSNVGSGGLRPPVRTGDLETARVYHAALKRYLGPYLNTDLASDRQNKARDKLLRLSRQQFQELSQDVFDELSRRQGGTVAPRSLPENEKYHPKRNQARQKLSTLPPSRFKDLATDVYHELVRRYPEFDGGAGAQRERSPARAPVVMGPPEVRPQPKTFQSNTLIPNKSQMVEESENEEESQPAQSYPEEPNQHESVSSASSYGGILSDNASITSASRALASPPASQVVTARPAAPADYEANIAGLQARVAALESDLARANEELKSARESADVAEQRQREAEGQAGQWRGLGEQNAKLKEDLRVQHEVTEHVRREAMQFLEEMKSLSLRESTNLSETDQLRERLSTLQAEVSHWKSMHSQARAQLRSLRAASVFGRAQVDRSNLRAENGAIDDGHFGNFQAAVDELLSSARSSNLQGAMMDSMKGLLCATRAINADLDQAPKGVAPDVLQRVMKLRQRLSATCSNLITACKNHIAARGLSPVSLVDAAASHLSGTVVELVNIVLLRPTSNGEAVLDDGDDTVSESGSSAVSMSVVGERTKVVRGSAALRTFRRRSSSHYSVDSPPPLTGPMPAIPSNLSPHTASAYSSENEHEQPRRVPVRMNERWSAISGSSYGGNGDGRDELEELKGHLETQTERIVEDIQALLSSIRADAALPELRMHMHDIVETVTNVVSRSRALSPASVTSISVIVKDLEGCATKVNEMRMDIEAEGAVVDKAYKQKLAGAAFDTAKLVKALMKAVEDSCQTSLPMATGEDEVVGLGISRQEDEDALR
ncbi:component of the polarisome [Saitoella coloradoensis]